MPKITINVSELRGIDDASVKDLAEFLGSKVEAKVEVTSGEIILNYEEGKKAPSKAHLRVLLRKFLHQAELKEDLRVILGKENVFIIKERKHVEEE
jgi:hypothetical protein